MNFVGIRANHEGGELLADPNDGSFSCVLSKVLHLLKFQPLSEAGFKLAESLVTDFCWYDAEFIDNSTQGHLFARYKCLSPPASVRPSLGDYPLKVIGRDCPYRVELEHQPIPPAGSNY